MGYRLSKIYTRTGDDGSTGLGDGKRTAKDSTRIEAIGAVDELNSALGILLVEHLPSPVETAFIDIQHRLFDLGGELSIPGRLVIDGSDVKHLEDRLDILNAELPPLQEFVLPGGSRAAALAHQARAICRRAERRLLTLAREETANPAALKYLNRLSDLLFVAARTLARVEGGSEVYWQPKDRKP